MPHRHVHDPLGSRRHAGSVETCVVNLRNQHLAFAVAIGQRDVDQVKARLGDIEKRMTRTFESLKAPQAEFNRRAESACDRCGADARRPPLQRLDDVECGL